MFLRRVKVSNIIVESKTESSICKFFKKITKFISLVLAITMLLTSIPFSNFIVLAQSNNEIVEPVELNKQHNMVDVPIDFEVNEKRDKYTKYFRKVDGTYEASFYDEAVHYFDGDKWKEINNSLNFDENTNDYENKENDFKIKLPKKISDNKKFKLSKDNYKIEWTINDINDSDINIIEGTENNSNNLRVVENVNQKVLYNNIFNNVNLEYVIKGEQIKENFILNDYIKDFSVSYNLKLNNLSVIEEEDNISFVNENGEKVFELGSYIMYDDNSDLSYDINVSLNQVNKDEYELIISPSDDWLSSAVYPVIVDPILQITNNETQHPIRDKYTYIYHDGSFDNQDELKVGGDGYNTYLELNLSNIINKPVITYASINLKYNNNVVGYKCNDCDIAVKEVKDSDSFDSISFDTQTGTNGATTEDLIVDYVVFNHEAVDPNWNGVLTWDITKLVQKWKYNDKSKGLVEFSDLTN